MRHEQTDPSQVMYGSARVSGSAGRILARTVLPDGMMVPSVNEVDPLLCILSQTETQRTPVLFSVDSVHGYNLQVNVFPPRFHWHDAYAFERDPDSARTRRAYLQHKSGTATAMGDPGAPLQLPARLLRNNHYVLNTFYSAPASRVLPPDASAYAPYDSLHGHSHAFPLPPSGFDHKVAITQIDYINKYEDSRVAGLAHRVLSALEQAHTCDVGDGFGASWNLLVATEVHYPLAAAIDSHYGWDLTSSLPGAAPKVEAAAAELALYPQRLFKRWLNVGADTERRVDENAWADFEAQYALVWASPLAWALQRTDNGAERTRLERLHAALERRQEDVPDVRERVWEERDRVGVVVHTDRLCHASDATRLLLGDAFPSTAQRRLVARECRALGNNDSLACAPGQTADEFVDNVRRARVQDDAHVDVRFFYLRRTALRDAARARDTAAWRRLLAYVVDYARVVYRPVVIEVAWTELGYGVDRAARVPCRTLYPTRPPEWRAQTTEADAGERCAPAFVVLRDGVHALWVPRRKPRTFVHDREPTSAADVFRRPLLPLAEPRAELFDRLCSNDRADPASFASAKRQREEEEEEEARIEGKRPRRDPEDEAMDTRAPAAASCVSCLRAAAAHSDGVFAFCDARCQSDYYEGPF